MQVILKEEVQGLGYEGDLVEVKDGYGRNYLLPQGMAVKATKENLAEWEEQKEELQAKRAEAEAKARDLAKVIEENIIIITAKAGEEGRIFGSVTNQNIADAFTEQTGEELDRRKIDLQENIKDLGKHTVIVKVFPEINAEMRVRVQNEDGQIITAEDEEEVSQEEQVEEVNEEVENTEENQETENEEVQTEKKFKLKKK